MSQSEGRAALIIILISYLVIGTLFAALTPAWQVPDEPAHYNYVRQLSAGIWPIIEIGDYDQGYLEELKAEGFPAGAAGRTRFSTKITSLPSITCCRCPCFCCLMAPCFP